MSWVTLALGLIRDVAATEQGQEIIKDIRSGGPSNRTNRPPPGREERKEEVREWRQSVEHRLSVTDRNVAVLVQMLNAQDESLVKIQKRQRAWNLALGAGILVAIGISIAWWLLNRG
jgi:hypothetical protein